MKRQLGPTSSKIWRPTALVIESCSVSDVLLFDAAVAEIDALLDDDPPPGSEGYDRLEFLSVLVQAYEDAHVPAFEQPTPQEVVDFVLEQRGLSRADLAKWLGGRSRTSEFFSGIRPLSLRQVGALKKHLGIPADVLLSFPP